MFKRVRRKRASGTFKNLIIRSSTVTVTSFFPSPEYAFLPFGRRCPRVETDEISYSDESVSVFHAGVH